jgi:hypothetical protein
MIRVNLGVESRIRSEQVADTCETQLHQSERPVVSKVRNYNKDEPNQTEPEQEMKLFGSARV